MLDPDQATRSRAQYNTIALTCAAITIIVPLLAIVVYVLHQSDQPPSGTLAPVAFYALAALAAIPMLTSRVLRHVLLWRGQRTDVVAAPGTPPVSAPGSDEALESGLKRLSAAMIVGMAAWEVPVIVGFVIYLLTGDWIVFGVFASVSLIGFAIFFPRRSQWDRLAEKVAV